MGCSKNLVDSEKLMTLFEQTGYHCTHDAKRIEGEIVVVNTCGFIEDAKQESIDTILELVQAKEEGKISKLFVMGCLSQRYQTGKPIVLDFWATWCGPCKKIGPDIEALATEYEGQAIIGKCDVEENDDLATRFGIRNVPTVLFIKNGEVVDKQVGAAPKATFEEKLKAIL